ncbi:hypothetical protein VOLCADRAFT_88912 [Volvox carteri f. nagariensis]|uniref:Uncharacterized protein n=1 Tax=Volvox carteri f. nagariensis TaxID=3068 RepID=D8TQA4_VOLCA|nr:uncharacterized protein VOLCADRAFT_88912 [Volvox carteri f. nagariensis]EFJ50500.1 hypothetical protein VOLCADRAFT_88912 [Volvox carteri f. nagariensis]|eukprot:XP_002948625.1 hypothetical protein VOLCADRAFT_88912 [Volvox carteri f. nagariensis]
MPAAAACSEDLSLQVVLTDDRLQRLEDKQAAIQAGPTGLAIMAAGMSNSGGAAVGGLVFGEALLDSQDLQRGSISGGALGLLGSQAPPPVLLPLATPIVNASTRYTTDPCKPMMVSRQLSMRHTRRLSAMEYGTLPDSEPLVGSAGAQSQVITVAAAAVAAAAGGGGGLDAQPQEAMTACMECHFHGWCAKPCKWPGNSCMAGVQSLANGLETHVWLVCKALQMAWKLMYGWCAKPCKWPANASARFVEMYT